MLWHLTDKVYNTDNLFTPAPVSVWNMLRNMLHFILEIDVRANVQVQGFEWAYKGHIWQLLMDVSGQYLSKLVQKGNSGKIYASSDRSCQNTS